MISSGERRRAVAELREASTGAYRHVDSLDVIAGAVGVEVGGKFSRVVENEIYAALADFIYRPTCHLVEDEDGYTACSECGCTALCMRDAVFCPSCGARVIHKEEDDDQ